MNRETLQMYLYRIKIQQLLIYIMKKDEWTSLNVSEFSESTFPTHSIRKQAEYRRIG
jgi:hypothetical protein